MTSRVLGYLRRNHLGLLAVVLALGGTAYAAAKVDSGDIKNKSLKNKDVKPGTLTAKQIGAESIGGAQLDETTLDATRVVARLRDSTDRTVPRNVGVYTNLGSVGPWTQRADEVDELIGQTVVSYPAGCNQPRQIQIVLARPGADPAVSPLGLAASAFGVSTVAGADTAILQLRAGSFPLPTLDRDSFEPAVDTPRTLNVFAAVACAGGSTADPVITDINLDVIGHR